jgi:hypothetical protein
MSDVEIFICYNSRDPLAGELATKLHSDLRLAGRNPFLDQSGLDGTEPDEQLKTALYAARHVVYCIGPDGEGNYQRTWESKWINDGLGAMRASGNRIVVALLKPEGAVAAMPTWASQATRVIDGDVESLEARLFERLTGQPLDRFALSRLQADPQAKSNAINLLLASIRKRGLTMFLDPHGGERTAASRRSRSRAALEHAVREAVLLNGPSVMEWLDALQPPETISTTLAAEVVMSSIENADLYPDTIRRIFESAGPAPSEPALEDLCAEVALFADKFAKMRTRDAALERRDSDVGAQSTFRGLLLVDTHPDGFLEKALMHKRVHFLRVEVSSSPALAAHRKLLTRFTAFEPNPTSLFPDAELEDELLEEEQLAKIRVYDVVVLKPNGVLDHTHRSEDWRASPLGFRHFIHLPRTRLQLPPQLERTGSNVPTLMLGGGLFEPTVQCLLACLSPPERTGFKGYAVIDPNGNDGPAAAFIERRLDPNAVPNLPFGFKMVRWHPGAFLASLTERLQ